MSLSQWSQSKYGMTTISGTLSGEATLLFSFLPLFNGVKSLKKEFAPHFGRFSVSREANIQECKQAFTIVVPH